MKVNNSTISSIPQKIVAIGSSFLKTKAEPATPPPAFSRKQIRIAVSAFFFCQGICFASWASRIPDLKVTLQLSDAALGTILFALPAGQFVAMPFSGRLVTHFGSRKVLRIAAVFYSFCLLSIGFSSAPWQLAASLFLFGVCGNMCNISANTQAVRAEKIFERPIMTSFHGVWSFAGFTGAAIGLLMMGMHWKPGYHFLVITILVITIIFIAQKYLQQGRSANVEKKSFFSKPDIALVQLGIIGFFSMASEGAMFDWSGVYFQQIVQAPKSLIALGYLTFMIAMATGRFIGDRLILAYGRKRMLRASGVLICSGLFLAVIFPHVITATIGFLVVGFGVSSIVPMVYSAAGKQTKIPPGMALASVSSISFLGFLMGPPLIGYVSEILNLRYSFALIGLLGLSISFMVSKIKALNE
jgi:MFS family permease